MAEDKYDDEDDSVAPEHAAAEIGEGVSKTARIVDALTPVSDLSAFGRDLVGKETFLDSIGITGTTTLFAGLTALGEGLKVADDVAHGDMKKAGKHLVVGSAKAAVVFFDGATMGAAELLSLVTTGKMLSTNVGNVVGQMLDGADKQVKPASNMAAVAFPGMPMTYAPPPPVEPQQVAPYGMQPPPGGWANYVAARRNQGVVQQPGEQEPAAVMSGNPRFASAVDVARDAASNQQLGPA